MMPRVKVAFRFGIRRTHDIAMTNKLVFLFDIDNTLLKSDEVTADLFLFLLELTFLATH